MSLPDLDIQTPLQRLIVQRALALAKELQATADAAPDGQVLDRCEALLLGAGRDFLRQALQDTLQTQATAAEKKGRPPAPAPAAPCAGTKGPRPGG